MQPDMKTYYIAVWNYQTMSGQISAATLTEAQLNALYGADTDHCTCTRAFATKADAESFFTHLSV